MTDRERFSVPLSGKEVQALRGWQANPWVHPLTCDGGLPPAEHVHDREVILEPTQQGLVCPGCRRVQTWIPSALLDEAIMRRLLK